jgi:hypothetical protein
MFLLGLCEDHSKAGYVALPIGSNLASDAIGERRLWQHSPKLALAGKQLDVTSLVVAVRRSHELRFDLHAAVDTR